MARLHDRKGCLNASRQSDSLTTLELAPHNSNHISGGTQTVTRIARHRRVALASFVQQRIGAVLIAADFDTRREQIIALAAQVRLGEESEESTSAAFRGGKPADLPDL